MIRSARDVEHTASRNRARACGTANGLWISKFSPVEDKLLERSQRLWDVHLHISAGSIAFEKSSCSVSVCTEPEG